MGVMLLRQDGGQLVRRSEITALTVAYLEWKDEGAVLTLRRSKPTKQGREGRSPSRAAPISPPVPRRRSAPSSTLPASKKGHCSGRSMGMAALAIAGCGPGMLLGRGIRRTQSEAGFATLAARNGAFAFNIMRQSGHRSIFTVFRCVRETQIFRDAPASKLGL